MELLEGVGIRDEVVEVLITHYVGHGTWYDELSLNITRFLDVTGGASLTWSVWLALAP
jgi:hypothetical protein